MHFRRTWRPTDHLRFIQIPQSAWPSSKFNFFSAFPWSLLQVGLKQILSDLSLCKSNRLSVCLYVSVLTTELIWNFCLIVKLSIVPGMVYSFFILRMGGSGNVNFMQDPVCSVNIRNCIISKLFVLYLFPGSFLNIHLNRY